MNEVFTLEEFHTMINSSYDGIHITDGEGTTLFYNQACERIEGNKKEDIIGKNMKDLVESGVYSESVALKSLQKKETVTIIQRINDNTIMATATPIFKNKKIKKVITNSRDITLLNNLQKELEHTKSINEKYYSELKVWRLQQENENIITNDLSMKKIIELAIHIANVDSSVLIQGESGVGKGIISHLIHKNSNRAKKPFMKIDCAAIAETLIESELFGYDKGAFTGADSNGKIGLIELANGGTLFLDEIGELSPSLQMKLLGVIQDREIVRVGGTKKIPVDIRVITATNKNLETMVKDKKFREDLYYRLNVIPILIPSLRDRRDDIYPLIMQKLKKINKKYSLNKVIEPNVLDLLISYDWPGNVRELENIIERLVVTTQEKKIGVKQLPSEIINNQADMHYSLDMNNHRSLQEIMDNFEKKVLLQVLKKYKTVKKVSEVLEVDPSTVRRKLNKYNI